MMYVVSTPRDIGEQDQKSGFDMKMRDEQAKGNNIVYVVADVGRVSTITAPGV